MLFYMINRSQVSAGLLSILNN